MATVVFDPGPDREALGKALGLQAIANTVSNLTQIFMEHRANVRQEKLMETQRLLDVGRSIGWENLGQKGLAKIEAGIGTQFNRDSSGNIVIPKDPERLLAEAQLNEATAHPDTFFRRTQSAPSQAALDLEYDRIEANREEAAEDRKNRIVTANIAAGASVQAARIDAISSFLKEQNKPEHQLTNLYAINGKIRQMDDDVAKRKGLKPLTQGQVDFYQKFKKQDLEVIEKQGNIQLLEQKARKTALDVAHAMETDPNAKQIFQAAGTLARAGDKKGSQRMIALGLTPFIEADPDLRKILEFETAPGVLGSWGQSVFDQAMQAHIKAINKQIPNMLGDPASQLPMPEATSTPAVTTGQTTPAAGGPRVLSTGRKVNVTVPGMRR